MGIARFKNLSDIIDKRLIGEKRFKRCNGIFIVFVVPQNLFEQVKSLFRGFFDDNFDEFIAQIIHGLRAIIDKRDQNIGEFINLLRLTIKPVQIRKRLLVHRVDSKDTFILRNALIEIRQLLLVVFRSNKRKCNRSVRIIGYFDDFFAERRQRQITSALRSNFLR